MCEETPAVVYCVGYVLPVTCCVAGACMSCYGCYRYYRAGDLRRRRLQRIQMEMAAFPDVLPRLKRDTLKRKMTKEFTKSVSADKEKGVMMSDMNEHVLKDMRDACPICMDSYEDDTKAIFIGLIKNCGHYFHFECLWNWLELNQTCPICREGCDLAETDLRGVSLEQVLKMVSSGNAKAQPLANFRESESQTSSIGSLTEIGSQTNSVSSSVAMATVITTQPRPPSQRTSSLIERMKQRFEAGDCETPRDAEGSSIEQIEGSGGHANPSYD